MVKKFILWNVTSIFSKLRKEERGISIVETAVGLGIFAFVGIVFLSGLATNFKGEMVRHREAMGEVIARSLIEYVKSRAFSDNEWTYTVSTANRSSIQQPSWWDIDNPPLLDSNYTGYYSVVSAEDYDVDGDEVLEVPGDDDSIRKITVEVYNNQNNLVVSLESQKVNR